MNVFELFAKLGLDTSDYDKNLNSAKDRASGIGSALATGAKVGVAAIGAAATAVGVLAKKSVDAYAEYEQLEGGIQTLYGENSKATQEMMQNASEAWKTAGLSANEYMNTAIESSAAMLNSLGGDADEAAKLMDQTIIDMSDNVNKMGTSMESIQNAYRGFSRGNFTMLDNLALGFAGTKEGMQELLDKAEELSGVKFDISSYADIVQAIHVVQEEMGIAGTTQREATETIQGSLNALKSAWQNLVTGFADPNADIGNLIENMVDAGVTALNNLIPAIERALVGIGQGVQKVVPVITEKLPQLVNDLLPPLLDAATQLVQGIVTALPDLLKIIVEALPDALMQIIEALTNMMPQITDAIHKIIASLMNAVAKGLPDLIPIMIDAIIKTIEETFNNAAIMTEAVMNIINGLITGIVKALPNLIKEIPNFIKTVISAILNCLPILIQGMIDLVFGIVEHIPEIIVALIEAIPDIIVKVAEAVFENFPTIILAVIKGLGLLLVKIGEWFLKLFGLLDDEEEVTSENIGEWFETLFADIGEWLSNIFESIGEFFSSLFERIGNFFKGIWETISNFFSSLFKNIGTWLSGIFKGIGEWFKGLIGKVGDWVKGIFDRIANFFKRAWELGKNLVDGIWKGIKDNAEGFWRKIKNWLESVWGGIKDFFGVKSPSKQMAWLGEMLSRGLAGGIEDYSNLAVQAAEDMSNGIASVFDEGYQVPISAYGDTGLFDSATPNEYDDEMYIDGFGDETLVPRVQDIASRDITIILELDGTEFARTVYKANNEETQRVGVRLAGVGA